MLCCKPTVWPAWHQRLMTQLDKPAQRGTSQSHRCPKQCLLDITSPGIVVIHIRRKPAYQKHLHNRNLKHPKPLS
jgi:hypothetical protein